MNTYTERSEYVYKREPKFSTLAFQPEIFSKTIRPFSSSPLSRAGYGASNPNPFSRRKNRNSGRREKRGLPHGRYFYM
jgi:hypothetical protein